MKAATKFSTASSGIKSFQSTPPVKAATRLLLVIASRRQISIHAAREGGDPTRSCDFAASDISIHAAREGGDRFEKIQKVFIAISIHAAREGGDVADSPV